MSPRFLPLLLSVACTLALGNAPRALGQTATTDPVGMVQVALPADSDSYVYIPFKRTPEYVGTASGAPTANNDGTGTISLAGTPGLTANQFVYAAGTQPKTYYALITDGTKAGMYYTVVGNTTAAITVDLAGDNLSSAVASGTHLQIIPFDTLGSIFPGGQGVVPSPTYSLGSRQTEVLILNGSQVGINPSAGASYFYYSGTNDVGPGWREAGDFADSADTAVLYPDTFLIVRNKAGNPTSLTFTGTVPMSSLQVPVNVLQSNTTQDNPVALPVPAALTLAQTQLFQSGAFAGTSQAGQIMDQLLVWDGSVTGHDRSANRIYYYYTGTDGNGPGWRLSTDPSTVRDNLAGDSIFGSTSVMVIRKKGTTLAGTSFWSVKPPYVP